MFWYVGKHIYNNVYILRYNYICTTCEHTVSKIKDIVFPGVFYYNRKIYFCKWVYNTLYYNIFVVCCHPADDSDGKAGGSSLLGVVVGLLVFSALICFGLRLSTASRPRHFPTTNLYPNKLLCSRQTSRSPFIDFWRDVRMCVCVCVCMCARAPVDDVGVGGRCSSPCTGG